jgi:hypothetical protein
VRARDLLVRASAKIDGDTVHSIRMDDGEVLMAREGLGALAVAGVAQLHAQA